MSPTLSTANVLSTLETEFSKNQNSAERLEARIENIRNPRKLENLTNKIAASRARMSELLIHTNEIKEISNPLKQKEDFSAEIWNQRFVRLGDINEMDGLFPEGEKLRMLIWSRVPDCRFKRIQEVYCQPEDFCVPRFAVVDKRIVFSTGTRFDDLSLDPILMDINLVSDSLLEKLQIVEFPEEDPVGHLKAKAGALPRLKEILERATQLSPKNKRILIIASQHNQTASIEADVRGAPDAVEGAIIYLKTDDKKKSPTKKEQFERRSAQFFKNGYDAKRKTHHEELAYTNEIRKITKLIVRIKKINGEIDDRWKPDTADSAKQDMRSRANELFRECAETLQFCSNLYKVKAKTRVKTIQSHISEDATKQPNISAVMTCMTSAREDLQKRAETDVVEKSGFNQNDRAGLEAALEKQEGIIDEYGKGIIEVAESFADNPDIFEPDYLSPGEIPVKTQEFLLQVRPDLLDEITMAPFVTYTARLREKYDALGAAVSMQDKENAAQILIQMHVIKKFSDVQKEFENIKEKIIDPRFVSVDVIRTFITDLNREFFAFQIFGDTIVDSYVPAYESMRSSLAVMEKRLAHYEAQKTMTIEERTEMYGRMKEYLDSFDIPTIVSELD